MLTRLETPVATLPEPIHAWRTWTLVGSRDGSRVRLAPIAGDGRPWPPRRPAEASCTRHRSHVRPELDCTCAYPQRLRLLCYLCFTSWGSNGPGDCEVVVRHRRGRMVPLCGPHLELSRRYGYHLARILSARTIESELLATYAVDLLRELVGANGGTAESISA